MAKDGKCMRSDIGRGIYAVLASHVCPDCNGSGALMRHICGGNEERCYRLCPDVEPCARCNATGFVNEPNSERSATGAEDGKA